MTGLSSWVVRLLFGKGTVQRFIDLDQSISSDFSEFKPLGSIKLTIQKFYRINGGTNQLKGVIPDVILPDAYAYIEVGEKEQEYSMPWDEITPADFDLFDHPTANREEVLVNSRNRVANHPTFQLIEENAQRLKKQRGRICLYTLFGQIQPSTSRIGG